MFATRIVPLVFAVAVMSGGVANAQTRTYGRVGYPPVTPRYVPPAYVPPPVYVPVKPVQVQPYVRLQPTVTPLVVPKPVYVAPVGYYNQRFPTVYGSNYSPTFVPFWGGLWWNYPVYAVTPISVIEVVPPVVLFGW